MTADLIPGSVIALPDQVRGVKRPCGLALFSFTRQLWFVVSLYVPLPRSAAVLDLDAMNDDHHDDPASDVESSDSGTHQPFKTPQQHCTMSTG